MAQRGLLYIVQCPLAFDCMIHLDEQESIYTRNTWKGPSVEGWRGTLVYPSGSIERFIKNKIISLSQEHTQGNGHRKRNEKEKFNLNVDTRYDSVSRRKILKLPVCQRWQ